MPGAPGLDTPFKQRGMAEQESRTQTRCRSGWHSCHEEPRQVEGNAESLPRQTPPERGRASVRGRPRGKGRDRAQEAIEERPRERGEIHGAPAGAAQRHNARQHIVPTYGGIRRGRGISLRDNAGVATRQHAMNDEALLPAVGDYHSRHDPRGVDGHQSDFILRPDQREHAPRGPAQPEISLARQGVEGQADPQLAPSSGHALRPRRRAENRAAQGPREEPTGAYAVVREDRRRPRTPGCDGYRHGATPRRAGWAESPPGGS